VIPTVALLLPIVIGFLALALDFGTIYAHRRSLQNAADAAALAGAGELRKEMLGQPSDPTGRALAVAAGNGVATPGASCRSDGKTTVVINTDGPPSMPHSWQVQTSKLVQLTFGAVIGIPNQCVTAGAIAEAGMPLLDVMLSLDTTGSMTMTGAHDFDELRQAVVDFINQMNPDPSNPRTTKLGLARFKCVFDDWGRYVEPCQDDATLLSPLTSDKQKLLTIAAGGAGCPAGVSPYGCPINHVSYTAPGAPRGWEPYYTGTKLPNGFSILNRGSYYAWGTAAGGRNDSQNGGYARKAMVFITDGQNEESPPGNFPQSVSGYDQQVRALANQMKLGPDGQAGTPDDVEIYVVGYFCTPYRADLDPPNTFCKSQLADWPSGSGPHPCPGPQWPPPGVTPSTVDQLLYDLSSSTPGTCDHYYPLRKSESLPQLVQAIAGRLSRVRLRR
jgi:Flp pilus assembly protein TadG